MITNKVRTRLAFSPIRFMTLEDLRNALFTYLIAKKNNGKFILRIDDVNQNNYDSEMEEYLYNMLDIFHLNYQEGPKSGGEYEPYIQSERLNIYIKYAEYLVNEGNAYYCFCDEAELNRKRVEALADKQNNIVDECFNIPLQDAKKRIKNGEKYVIRQRIPEISTTSFSDLVYKDISLENENLEDQILIKSDGFPTYNFACVIDDALMNITHVTRPNNYLSSTPKSILLLDALPFEKPEYLHYPLLLNNNGKHFDKRDRHLEDLLNVGFLPEAIINYLALLGWSPKTNQEFFSLEELEQCFNVENINRRVAYFDIQKLKWFNHNYIMKMEDDKYIKFIKPFLEKSYNISNKSEEWIKKLLLLFKKQIFFGEEISLVTNMFFLSDIIVDEECNKYISNCKDKELIYNTFKEKIKGVDNWDINNILEVINNVQEKIKITGTDFYLPLRILLTGRMQGPSLIDVMYLLGKEEILKRLEVL